MNGFYSKPERITRTVQIWAKPRGPYDADDAPAFTYELERPWRDGEVLIASQEVTLDVPGGINLMAQAIVTLEKKRAEALETYMDACKSIDEKVSRLRLLSGPVQDGGDIEGSAEVLDDEAF